MSRETLDLLVVRARLEEGSSSPLRAEVRITKDVSAGFERVLNLRSVDAVVETVRKWLQHIVEGGIPGGIPVDTEVEGGPACASTTGEEP